MASIRPRAHSRSRKLSTPSGVLALLLGGLGTRSNRPFPTWLATTFAIAVFGLSVVLEFVSAHGGTVQIIDGQFPGAHFRITMPMRATDAPLTTLPKAHAHAA